MFKIRILDQDSGGIIQGDHLLPRQIYQKLHVEQPQDTFWMTQTPKKASQSLQNAVRPKIKKETKDFEAGICTPGRKFLRTRKPPHRQGQEGSFETWGGVQRWVKLQVLRGKTEKTRHRDHRRIAPPGPEAARMPTASGSWVLRLGLCGSDLRERTRLGSMKMLWGG